LNKNLFTLILFAFLIPINTNPTGFSLVPPFGPAIPVIETAIFVLLILCLVVLKYQLKSFVLKKSLSLKINLLNDVSGLSHDSKMINILKTSKIPFVLHHMQGTPKSMQKNPKYRNVTLDIYDFFEKKLEDLRSNKINHKNIILDPGIGFGKNLKHNITILNQISIFLSLGFPVLLGLSKKRFIKELSGNNDSKSRIGGTTSSCIYAIMQGVQILRVHDVNEIKQAMAVFKKLIFNK